jgi:hypothetical protein
MMQRETSLALICDRFRDQSTAPLLSGLKAGIYQVNILPYAPEDDSLYIKEIGTELYFLLFRKSSVC